MSAPALMEDLVLERRRWTGPEVVTLPDAVYVIPGIEGPAPDTVGVDSG